MSQRSFRYIGRYLRQKRLLHPKFYSQNKLSKLLGYKNGQFISNVERGICGVPLKSLHILIDALDLDKEEVKEIMLKDFADTLDNFLAQAADKNVRQEQPVREIPREMIG